MSQHPRTGRLTKWIPTLYFLAGQAGWFACTISAARHRPFIGALFALVLVAVHLLRVPRPLEECKFLAIVVLIGASWESVLVQLHLVSYSSGVLLEGVAPYWIVVLWALFAAQFNTTYTWMKGRIIIGAVLGAIAGPLSFRAGASLGALQFPQPWLAMVAIALGWACLLPLLIVLARRWDGVQPLPMPGST